MILTGVMGPVVGVGVGEVVVVVVGVGEVVVVVVGVGEVVVVGVEHNVNPIKLPTTTTGINIREIRSLSLKTK